MSSELAYIALLFALFVIPKALQRFRIPGAITSLLLGLAAARAGLFTGDPTLALLATLGITGLFLFAGLDVDAKDLRRGAALVAQHLVIQALLLAGVAWAIAAATGVAWRPATLVALALVTPSTGFILDSLQSFGLDADQRFWTRTKAVATELLALAVLFAVLQSTSAARFAGATAALLAVVVLIPLVMKAFAVAIAPWAPRSEFAFLVMLAVMAAFATRKLGVYYLVGAFLVGVAARRFRERLPAFSSDRLLHAVEVFASFFAPFYFFSAGAHLHPELLTLSSLAAGLVYLAAMIPLRVGLVAVHRRLALRERLGQARRVATALVPTLVFSLVLAEIVIERFEGVPPWLVGGIIPYALLNTMIPALTLGATASFEEVHLDVTVVEPEPQPDATMAAAPPAGPRQAG
ncbi:cation:proton antiporter [Anaeromyxobacter dehalogenans]|uniref:cation:proton antiporter n=1 Tax=Anaeromyxobacter dehalogenans TaxID=161493 RepID=UPI000311C4C5|nr:cation:proton antiporter [Anaeromyxobacter dehalogenans]